MRVVFDQFTDFIRNSKFADKIAEVVEKELDRIGDENANLIDALHLQTSTGDALDKHGANLGLSRDPGESDELFKQRIMLEIRILTSEGTIDDVQGAFVKSAWLDKFNKFNQEKTEVVEFHGIDNDAFFELRIDSNLLNGFFEGTFGYTDSDGNNQDSSIRGYNDGVYSGSIGAIPASLIEDIVKRLRPAGVSARVLKEGEFGYANSEGETNDPTIEGYNVGRYSTIELNKF